MVRVEKAGGFFVVRSAGVQSIGSSWPEGAVASAAKRRTVSVLGRDKVAQRDGHSVEDELSLAIRDVKAGAAKSIAIGRYVGQFGRTNLYERVFDVSGEGATPLAFCDEKGCPAGVERKTVHLKIAKGAKARRIEGFASTPAVDRDRDVVDPGAFVKSMSTFMQNPIMLFNHDVSRPVGRVVDFSVKADGLWIAGEIVDNQVWDWIDAGVLRALSASFIIKDRKIEQLGAPGDPESMVVRRITEAELLEVSVASIPTNQTAIFNVAKAIRDGSDVKCNGCASETHVCTCGEAAAVVEHRRFALAAKGAIDFRRDSVLDLGGIALDRQCVLIDKDGSPTLRHHGVQGGDVVTSPEAVRAGMAALAAYSETSAGLSEAERVAAWKHLTAHAREAGLADDFEGIGLKGPQPELTATLLGASERGEWSIGFSMSTYKDAAACKQWLSDHGFAELDDLGTGTDGFRRFGGSGDELLERHALDNGVVAALYQRHEKIETVTTAKKDEGTTTAAAAPAAAPPSPPPAASPPAGETPASKAGATQATDELVEVDTNDLAALERVHAAAQEDRPVDPDDMKQAMNLFEGDQPA